MCVVALAWQSHPRWRLVLVGNRDEFHARPTAPLARWQERPRVLAGRDLLSGGTWLGVDDAGRVAVVTNVRDGAAPPMARSSRGALPLAFLDGALDAAAATARLAVEAEAYGAFNLVVADEGACWHVGNHPAGRAPFPPGIHALSNGRPDAPWPKTRRLAAALEGWLASETDDLASLWQALADERGAPDNELPDTGVGIELERRLAPVFIRGATYGTRASSIVLVDHEGRGRIHERRFGPHGVFEGETTLDSLETASPTRAGPNVRERRVRG